MDDILLDFYKQLNIGQDEDSYLLSLSECCTRLEEQLYDIAKTLSPTDRQIIEGYIVTKNDLEIETIKSVLRLKKKHYKR